MGLGMLGAMGGLGQAGSDVGKELMQDALKQDEIAALEKRQLAIKQAEMQMAQNFKDKERQDVADVVNGVQKTVPFKGEATGEDYIKTLSPVELQRAQAAALRASGRVDEADKMEARASQSEHYGNINDNYTAKTEETRRMNDERIRNNMANNDLRARGQDMRSSGGAGGGGGNGRPPAYLSDIDKSELSENSKTIMELRKELTNPMLSPEEVAKKNALLSDLVDRNFIIRRRAAQGGEISITNDDIEDLVSNYAKGKPDVIRSFNRLFGEGAAQKVLAKNADRIAPHGIGKDEFDAISAKTEEANIEKKRIADETKRRGMLMHANREALLSQIPK